MLVLQPRVKGLSRGVGTRRRQLGLSNGWKVVLEEVEELSKLAYRVY